MRHHTLSIACQATLLQGMMMLVNIIAATWQHSH
jgi:hypothetical protein